MARRCLERYVNVIRASLGSRIGSFHKPDESNKIKYQATKKIPFYMRNLLSLLIAFFLQMGILRAGRNHLLKW